jgi:hypothetical protein
LRDPRTVTDVDAAVSFARHQGLACYRGDKNACAAAEPP